MGNNNRGNTEAWISSVDASLGDSWAHRMLASFPSGDENTDRNGQEWAKESAGAFRGVRLQWVCRRRKSMPHKTKGIGKRLVLKSFQIVTLSRDAIAARPPCAMTSRVLSPKEVATSILVQMPHLPAS